MNRFNFDIQNFAEGDIVHSTEGYINCNDSTKSESYSEAEGGMSAEMKTFYDKVLIELATPALVHDQFGQKRPIPPSSGKTIEFRKFSTLKKALKAIEEGVTPNGNKLSVIPVTATVDQYGDYIEMTDMFELSSIDNVILEATRVLADQAGRTMDTVVRNVILGGSAVSYASKGGQELTSRAELDSTSLLTVKDVFKAAAQLRAQNAPTFDGSYVAIIHPYVAYDLMQEAGDQWVDIAKYANPASLLTGEIGTLGGVRFVQTSEAKIYAAEDLSKAQRNLTVSSCDSNIITLKEALDSEEAAKLEGRYIIVNKEKLKVTSAAEGEAGSAAITLEEEPSKSPAESDIIYPGEAGSEGVSVFATIFLGRDAYGTTEIEGGGIQHIVKQKGFGNDPLNQRSSVGWKGVKAAVRLAEPYMLRYESGSTFSTTSLEGN